ncbi:MULTISPECIES: siderophore-interacting protein [unclassified Bosea (in: a-proteobacteria)]|uniref:siderophore-interacting protein n=1 Tax=unclassified Bosea (in: a-proteobacteria) TaxID=2653178 RepID=UPI000F75FAC7|nr:MULTISPECIES: siderophore-interacting protein [unclassified Bosea (in: a-proteobacteria)]AZO78050.1 NADPH-dependent ferric siderophore reductase [Bosea sp. Tri-49]RXT19189.1 NADPH-dependent ferric siderophore reductase [Bosea sp. Tri-39]RXT41461.1 NADPH-dependent ferric siderophore reductase [Bosea sp. Tri-54]
MGNADGTSVLSERLPKRQRHKVVLRQLDVLRVSDLSPSMRRVTLGGPELEGFVSLGFDDHVKMFFAAPGKTEPVLPVIGPDGLAFPESGPRPLARDFTPRRHDPQTTELDIDFALLHDGPASHWASAVKPGDSAWIAGPRGSFIVPFDFDWHLLVADETGLPALARRLDELPQGSRAIALIEVADEREELPLHHPPGIEVIWAHRAAEAEPGAALLAALRALDLPAGDYFAWIACESSAAKRLRSVLIDERGANRKWVRAHGYWRRGAIAVHDDFDE